MTKSPSLFVFTKILAHRRHIRIAAFCAIAMGLTALRTEAQSRNGDLRAEEASEQLLEARSKQNAGDYNAARDILMKALAEAPNSAPLLDAFGSVQQDRGEYLEAERSYLRALSASAATEGDPE